MAPKVWKWAFCSLDDGTMQGQADLQHRLRRYVQPYDSRGSLVEGDSWTDGEVPVEDRYLEETAS